MITRRNLLIESAAAAGTGRRVYGGVNHMQKLVRAIVSAFSVTVLSIATQAAEVKVIATAAVSDAFKEIVPDFERASGHKLILQYHATPVVLKQIESGEQFDLAIGVLSAFESANQDLFTGAKTPVATVGLGVAVRAGAAKPDLSSSQSFKAALLNARSISLLPDSVNGKHFLSVFEKLGIADVVKPKLMLGKTPSDVPQSVAKGEAEMALFVSNLLVNVSGVDYVGPIPAEFQQTLVFAAVLGAKAREPAAANALVQHLRAAPAAASIKAHGMNAP
jgi:molybdate transport system substrate-binding protein